MLIDWQLIQKNVGALDVAYFLAGNFPIDVRRYTRRSYWSTSTGSW